MEYKLNQAYTDIFKDLQIHIDVGEFSKALKARFIAAIAIDKAGPVEGASASLSQDMTTVVVNLPQAIVPESHPPQKEG